MSTITVTSRVAQVWARGQGPALLANQDTAVPIYVSGQRGVTSADNVIAPLGTLGIDGTADWFASTLTSDKADLQIIPGGTSWFASPSTTAIVNTDTVTGLASGASTTVGPFPVTQIGYEVFFDIVSSQSAALSVCQIRFQWIDSASGLIIKQESWYVSAGAANAAHHQITGTGPSGGDQVQVIIANPAISTGTITVEYTLLQTPRIFSRSDWRSLQLGAASFTQSGVLTDFDVLTNTFPAISGGGTTTRILPLYTGNVNLFLSTSSNTNDALIEVVALPTALVNTSTIFSGTTGASGLLETTIALPRVQCSVELFNNNAAQQALGLVMIINEQDV